jgi:hypothetical protein
MNRNQIYPIQSTIPVSKNQDIAYECAVGVIWGSLGCICVLVIIIILLTNEDSGSDSGFY